MVGHLEIKAVEKMRLLGSAGGEESYSFYFEAMKGIGFLKNVRTLLQTASTYVHTPFPEASAA